MRLSVVGFLFVLVLHLIWWGVLFISIYPLKLISKSLFRSVEETMFKCISYIFVLWVEDMENLQFVFYGDELPQKEGSVLSLPNHISSMDFFVNLVIAAKRDLLGFIRFTMKASLKHVPPAGQLMNMHEMIFLSRSWEKDKVALENRLDIWAEEKPQLYLCIYPEGTFITTKRLDVLNESKEFAAQRGLPVHHHVITPRTKGSEIIINKLRHTLDCVYSVTMAFDKPFEPRLGDRDPPLLTNLLNGQLTGQKVHVHISRIPMSQVPQGDGVKDFIFNLFDQKEKLLAHFGEHYSFPGQSRSEDFTPVQKQRMWLCTLFPPFFALLLALNLFVNVMGGWLAAAPYLIVSLLLNLTIALVAYMNAASQGGKKSSKSNKSQ